MRVHVATHGVTIETRDERGVPQYVQFTHQEMARLQFVRWLYEHGRISDEIFADRQSEIVA